MQEDGAGGGQPPIIVKKVVAAGGHHGGAWKVAYADFVTAMMALFMVLWLMNANQETKQAVAAYFQDPKGVGEKLGSGEAGSGSGRNGMAASASSVAPPTISVVVESGSSATLISAFQLAWHNDASRTATKTNVVI